MLAKDAVVDLEFLIKSKMIDETQARQFGVKILGDGEINIPLTVKLLCSKGAKAKIEKAGGKVVG